MGKKRERGHYWCRKGNDWTIGYYGNGSWGEWGFLFNGDRDIVDENFLDEIDENIILRKEDKSVDK